MAPVSFVVDRVSEFNINGISLKEGIQKSGFSRKDWFENIVKTEKISCVVISTFSLSLNACSSEFPALFTEKTGEKYKIPTLCIHGSRGGWKVQDEMRNADSEEMRKVTVASTVSSGEVRIVKKGFYTRTRTVPALFCF